MTPIVVGRMRVGHILELYEFRSILHQTMEAHLSFDVPHVPEVGAILQQHDSSLKNVPKRRGLPTLCGQESKSYSICVKKLCGHAHILYPVTICHGDVMYASSLT